MQRLPAIVCALLLSGCALAPREGNTVSISGYLDQRMVNAVEIVGIPHGGVVRLDSVGGDVGPALKLVQMVATAEADTVAVHRCFSACVYVWAAGVHRTVADGARLGVHRMTAGDAGNQGAALMMIALGAPKAVVGDMLRTPTWDIKTVTPW